MMMNCFCGMVDRRKAFSLISSRDHCQRSSPSRISDTPRAGFYPAQNLGSGLIEWSCAVVITTTPLLENEIFEVTCLYLMLYFPSYSRKCGSCFMLPHLMTSWHLNMWKVKICLSQKLKELLNWNEKHFTLFPSALF